MTRSKQPQVWVLIADGERARIVVPDEQEGRFRQLLPLGIAEHPHYPPALRHEPHHLDKHQFATEIAHRLNEEAEHGAFDQLVLVAPGHVLSAIREGLSKIAAPRVVGTMPKDYTRIPDPDAWELLAKWWLAPPVAQADNAGLS
jgi:protein required for attachment to host cells